MIVYSIRQRTYKAGVCVGTKILCTLQNHFEATKLLSDFAFKNRLGMYPFISDEYIVSSYDNVIVTYFISHDYVS